MPSDAAIRCRTLGHSWDPIPVTKPPAYGIAIDLRCEHCFTIRRDIVSRYTGKIMSRRYDYEDGYKDTEHNTRSDWRVMWVDTLSDALRVVGPIDDEELGNELEADAPIRILSAGPKKQAPRRAS